MWLPRGPNVFYIAGFRFAAVLTCKETTHNPVVLINFGHTFKHDTGRRKYHFNARLFIIVCIIHSRTASILLCILNVQI